MKNLTLAELATKNLTNEQILAEYNKVLTELKSQKELEAKIENAEKEMATAISNYIFAMNSDADQGEAVDMIESIIEELKYTFEPNKRNRPLDELLKSLL